MSKRAYNKKQLHFEDEKHAKALLFHFNKCNSDPDYKKNFKKECHDSKNKVKQVENFFEEHPIMKKVVVKSANKKPSKNDKVRKVIKKKAAIINQKNINELVQCQDGKFYSDNRKFCYSYKKKLASKGYVKPPPAEIVRSSGPATVTWLNNVHRDAIAEGYDISRKAIGSLWKLFSAPLRRVKINRSSEDEIRELFLIELNRQLNLQKPIILKEEKAIEHSFILPKVKKAKNVKVYEDLSDEEEPFYNVGGAIKKSKKSAKKARKGKGLIAGGLIALASSGSELRSGGLIGGCGVCSNCGYDN